MFSFTKLDQTVLFSLTYDKVNGGFWFLLSGASRQLGGCSLEALVVAQQAVADVTNGG